ncbi:ATPase domain protein, prokaryote domain protein, partial [mine drainage metagenome]
MEFVDRVEELKALKYAYESKNASFVVLYGRRRLGKTELIKQFLKGVDSSAYYLATEEGSAKQLRSFSNLVGMRLGDEDLARFGSVDWESLFLRISKAELKSRLV